MAASVRIFPKIHPFPPPSNMKIMFLLLYFSFTGAKEIHTSIFRGVDDLDQSIEECISPGGNVYTGKFPYVAAVFNALGKFHTCTGVIIHERVVLTAGYCVSRGGEISDPKYISILAGVTDMRDRDYGQWKYAEVIIPSNFTYRSSAALVLIKVNSPFYLDFTSKRTDWPAAPRDKNAFCKALTWRFKDKLNRLTLKSLVLKEFSVYVLNQTSCEVMYENNPVITGLNGSGFMCMNFVAYVEPGTMDYECVGNDGSLILCEESGSFYPSGIASGLMGGSSCNRMDVPYPFFDVGSFNEWIRVELEGIIWNSDGRRAAERGAQEKK